MRQGVENVNDAGSRRFYGKDHFDLGVRAASSSGTLIRWLVKALSRWVKKHPDFFDQIVRDARRRSRLLPVEYPARMIELEGLARGLGLNKEDLLCARSIMESFLLPQCTNFGAVPPATKDENIVLSWNFDITRVFKLLMGRLPLFAREVEGTLPYVCVGVPVFFGIGILNAEGLCCVINAVGMADDGEGLSPFELNNKAMESCSTVQEAAKIFEEGPRQATKSLVFGVLMNWNMIWADRQANLSLFEYSHNHFHQQPAEKEGIIASANHHQFLDRKLSGGSDPNTQKLISGSYSRLARMWSLLREYHGRLDPRIAKLITSDHIPDYTILKDYGIERQWWQEKVDNSTICAHAWNTKNHLKRGEIGDAFLETAWSHTLYSFQVLPLEYTIWFTSGNPCRNDPKPIFWGRLLGAKTEPPPAILAQTDRYPLRTQRERRGMFRQDAKPLEKKLTETWFEAVDIVERSNFE